MKKILLFILLFVSCVFAQYGTKEALSINDADAIESQRLNNDLRILKSGNCIYIRSYFNDTIDVVQKMVINTNKNYNIGFETVRLIGSTVDDSPQIYEGGTFIHNTSDNICPVNTVNCGYIGGNHGVIHVLATSTHDKTSADIGSEWTDGSSHNWYLIYVNGDTLRLLPKGTGSPWTMYQGLPTSLTHVANATHTADITITASQLSYDQKITKNRSYKFVVNNANYLPENKVVYTNSFDIVETYDVVDPTSYTFTGGMTWDWENGETWFTQQLTYRFQPRGALIIDNNIVITRPLRISYIGAIQSAALNTDNYDKLYYYMPGAKASRGYDLQNIADMTGTLSFSLNYADSILANTDKAIDRLVMFLADNDGTRRVGFTHGYNTVYDDAQNTKRVSNGIKWTIYTSKKSYPHLNDYSGAVSSGIYHAVAYQQYFDPQLVPNATAVTYHKLGGDDYVNIDVHTALTSATISLPDEFTGKTITILDSSGVTVNSGNIVNSAGIVITTTGYGYLKLKLSSTDPYLTFAYNQSPITAPLGSTSLSSIKGLGQAKNTGIGFANSNVPVNIYYSGTAIAQFGQYSTNIVSLLLNSNSYLNSDGANIISMRNGVNNQQFRLSYKANGTLTHYNYGYLKTDTITSGGKGFHIGSATTGVNFDYPMKLDDNVAFAVDSLTSDQTLNQNRFYVLAVNGITIYLPTGNDTVMNGSTFIIKAADASACTVKAIGTTIDGAASDTITAMTSKRYVYRNGKYWIM